MAINIQNIIAALEAKVAAATSQTETQELIVLIKTIKASGQQTLVSYASQAALPAANQSNAGNLAYVADVGAIFFSNGTTWAQVGTGSGGGTGGTGGGTAYDQSLNTTDDVVFNSSLIGDVSIIGNEVTAIDSYGAPSTLVVSSNLDVKVPRTTSGIVAISGEGYFYNGLLRFSPGQLSVRAKTILLSAKNGNVFTNVSEYSTFNNLVRKIEVTGTPYAELDYYGNAYVYVPCVVKEKNINSTQPTFAEVPANNWVSFWGEEFTYEVSSLITATSITEKSTNIQTVETTEVITPDTLEVNKLTVGTAAYKNISIGSLYVTIDSKGDDKSLMIEWTWASTPPSAATISALTTNIGNGSIAHFYNLYDTTTYQNVELQAVVDSVEIIDDQYNPGTPGSVKYHLSGTPKKRYYTWEQWQDVGQYDWGFNSQNGNGVVEFTGGTLTSTKLLASFGPTDVTIPSLNVSLVNGKSLETLTLNTDGSKSIDVSSTNTLNYSGLSWMTGYWRANAAVVTFDSLMGNTYSTLQNIAAGDTFKLYDTSNVPFTFTCVTPLTYNPMYNSYEIVVLEKNPDTMMNKTFSTSFSTDLTIIKPINVKPISASVDGVTLTDVVADSALIGDVSIIGNTVSAIDSYGLNAKLTVDGDLEVTGDLIIGNVTGTPTNTASPTKFLKSYILDLVPNNFTVTSANTDAMYSYINGYSQQAGIVTNNAALIAQMDKLKAGDMFAISSMYGVYSNLTISSITKQNGGGMNSNNVTYTVKWNNSTSFGQDAFYSASMTFTLLEQVKTQYYIPLYL